MSALKQSLEKSYPRLHPCKQENHKRRFDKEPYEEVSEISHRLGEKGLQAGRLLSLSRTSKELQIKAEYGKPRVNRPSNGRRSL